MGDLDCLAIYEDAELYDREFSDRDFDIAFWRQRALRAGGDVLEIACGTGRITLPLARAGVRVTGLDVSAPMLELARCKAERERLSIDWVHADCRDFSLGKPFRLIFIAANALQHLHDLASVEEFFRCVHKHLEPGGEFLLDVFNPDVAKLSRKPDVRYLFKEIPGAGGDPIRVEASSGYDDAAQLLRFELRYLDKTGQLLRTKQVGMRCFFPQELELLCRHGGWRVVEKFGSYNERPFTAGSLKQILVCQASS
jgi:SAM-dependent methyltransferase